MEIKDKVESITPGSLYVFISELLSYRELKIKMILEQKF